MSAAKPEGGKIIMPKKIQEYADTRLPSPPQAVPPAMGGEPVSGENNEKSPGWGI